MNKLKKVAVPILTALLLVPSASFAHAEVKPVEKTAAKTEGSVKASFIPANSYMPLISDPAGWQSRGSYTGTVYTGYNPVAIPQGSGVNWKSAGGDFKVEFNGVLSGNSFTAQLMEYDGSTSQTVGSSVRISGNGTLLLENISSFVDGTDNEAEFWVQVTQAYTDDTITAEGFD